MLVVHPLFIYRSSSLCHDGVSTRIPTPICKICKKGCALRREFVAEIGEIKISYRPTSLGVAIRCRTKIVVSLLPLPLIAVYIRLDEHLISPSLWDS